MTSQTLHINGKDIPLETGLFIGGDFRKAQAGKTFPVENPATGKEIIQVSEGLPEDVDDAVKIARQTFKSKSWVEYGAVNRAKNLIKLADLMEEHFEELVAIEMLDTGKTYTQASTLDVPASIGTLRYYAGWADKVLGQSNFEIPKVFGYTKREAVGVCGQIIPWNVSDLLRSYGGNVESGGER
jgi:aldehyde dehydrogenase (NAD+)